MKKLKFSQILSFTFMIIVLSFISLMNFGTCSKIITPYPLQDQYFDRIFRIQQTQTNKLYFLRLYCKQKDMLSISITEQLQFQEHPRYPIHATWKETPRMQKKLYTLFSACNVDFEVKNGLLNSENEHIISIKRKDNGAAVFTIQDFQYRQKDFIIIKTVDFSTKWGLGQRFQKNFHVTDGTWTVWNRDRPWEIDYGSAVRSGQTYGHQPVYLAKQHISKGKFHLLYFKNTHGFTFQSKKQSQQLVYKVTGGNIHFLLIIGQQPQNILKQYHQYIGHSHIPPFWSLGYHQSRWGYKSIEEVEQVIQQFQLAQLPIDTIWSDLDYMNSKAIFTVDTIKYPPQKVKQFLIRRNLHYVPLIDVGISLADSNSTNMGKQMKVFFQKPTVNIHANNKGLGEQYVGAVWPGRVHFVDFLHPNASNFWQSQLDRLHREVPFSGIWLDMNQPSNFQGNEYTMQSYRIQSKQSINMMTINVDLNHYRCSSNIQKTFKHSQVHAYYGHMSTLPTYNYLKKNGRPFIITRSNSVGTGVYAGHWTGDNVATWDFLRLSISGNFLFQIFGMQMVGADICGFRGNTNQQLCSRWMQVGSMYPFARNHNQNQSISQQPYRFGPKLQQTAQLSFMQRYSLLKQMYSTMISLNGTGSFYRPIIFEFPFDQAAYDPRFVQTQFMIGDYLLGTPIVQQSQTQRQVYFPGNYNTLLWYQLSYDKQNGFVSESMKSYRANSIDIIQNKLPSALPLFLKAGSLIFSNKAKTRTSYLDSTFTIIAGLDEKSSAKGHILQISDYNNQSDISSCIEKGCLLRFELIQTGQSNNGYKFILKWKKQGSSTSSNRDKNKLQIQRIVVYNKNKILKSKIGDKIIIQNSQAMAEFIAYQ